METRFRITGMQCAACSASVERAVGRLEGVSTAEVNLLAGQLRCVYDAPATPEGIMAAVEKAGFGAAPFEEEAACPAAQKPEQDESRKVRNRLIASCCFLAVLMYVSMGPMLGLPLTKVFMEPKLSVVFILTQFLLTLPVIFLNRSFFINGFKALFRRSPNMNSLIAVGSGASLAFGVYALYRSAFALAEGDMATLSSLNSNLYFESSAMILTLVTVGKLLEARAKKKTGDALSGLRALAPKTANVLRDGTESAVPVAQLSVGDVVICRPGERIPVDGIIQEGRAAVDQSSLTGESMPAELGPEDGVLSASVNLDGVLQIRATQVGGETTLSKMISLVEHAGASKAPAQKLADKVSGIFVPVVMLLAVLTAAIWLFCHADFSFALTLGVSVLVVSCPCALGLATPVAVTVAVGRCARKGVLVKSPDALEELRRVDTVVLDKTGTLTTGKLSVTDVLPAEMEKDAFLRAAASLERGSEHPVAKAIVAGRSVRSCPEGGCPLTEGSGFDPVESFRAIFGRGVEGILGGERWLGGNAALMEEESVVLPEEASSAAERLADEGKTPLFFARNGKYEGIIAVADTPRADSAEAVAEMKRLGLRVLMLTGDNARTAEAVRQKLGVDEVIAEVLPGDKAAVVERLRSEGRVVAMAGDGVNDAPALASADVGIAVGGGADIALDAAGLVLMRPSPSLIAETLRYSRRVRRIITQNLFWAFFYNVLGIPVAAGVLYPAFGLLLSPMLASGMMSLSSLFVVTNALRLRK